MLFGLPHGALDHLIPFHLRQRRLQVRGVLVVAMLYLAVASIYLGLWTAQPLIALASKSTVPRDNVGKKEDYAACGVREYVQFDPMGSLLVPRLLVWRLAGDGAYEAVAQGPGGGHPSAVLLGLAWVQVDRLVRLRDTAPSGYPGALLPRAAEKEVQGRLRAEAQVRQEAAHATSQAAARIRAEEQAEREATRAGAEATRAEAAEAEAELARLRALLASQGEWPRRLGGPRVRMPRAPKHLHKSTLGCGVVQYGHRLVTPAKPSRGGSVISGEAHILISPSLDALMQTAATGIVDAARTSIAAHGTFSIALSGGSTPRTLYALLASPAMAAEIAWEDVHVYWGDERHVGPDDAESNYRMAREALLDKVPLPAGNIHRIPAELPDPETVAVAYADDLRRAFNLDPGEFPRFDLILLGMGDDGHTASLFPHSAALKERTRPVLANPVPKLNITRITLSAPAINNAARIWFLITGGSKAEVLKAVLEGPEQPDTYPSQLISPVDGELVLLLDTLAAAALSPGLRQSAMAGLG